MAGLRWKAGFEAVQDAFRGYGRAPQRDPMDQGTGNGGSDFAHMAPGSEFHSSVTDGPTPIRRALGDISGKNKRTGILGINFSLASFLKQSQVFTSATGGFFQLAGAGIDWLLGKGIMLFVQFHQWFSDLRMKTVNLIKTIFTQGIIDNWNMLVEWFVGSKWVEGTINAIVKAFKMLFPYDFSKNGGRNGNGNGTPPVTPISPVHSVTTPTPSTTTVTNGIPPILQSTPATLGPGGPAHTPTTTSTNYTYTLGPGGPAGVAHAEVIQDVINHKVEAGIHTAFDSIKRTSKIQNVEGIYNMRFR